MAKTSMAALSPFQTHALRHNKPSGSKSPPSGGFFVFDSISFSDSAMKLVNEVKKFYKTNRRDLPWRKTRDPYKILVSEVMLQQTQVERVIPKYKAFLKEFPTAKRLADAKLSKVLSLWQGLGYNRRAKYLHSCAKALSKNSSRPSLRGYPQNFSRESFASLPEKLPGVGPYTRAAVEAFAHNRPSVFIETNIRTVFTHFYFPHKEGVADAELLPLIERDLKSSKMEPRDFYAALMDYGSYLKKSGVKINSQSKHYVKQKKFKGSNREMRGAILRELLKKPQTLQQLSKNFPHKNREAASSVMQLLSDGLVVKRGRKLAVAD
jgi:A/G-specific adenine glycosylase